MSVAPKINLYQGERKAPSASSVMSERLTKMTTSVWKLAESLKAPGTALGVEQAGRSEERAWLDRCVAGDERAIRWVLDRYRDRVVRLASHVLHNSREAEDVAQEALLRLWRSAGQIELGAAGLRPWLNRVTANLCLDRLRSRKIAPLTVEELPEVATPAGQQQGLEEAALSRRVDQALQALPERQRLALVLFHYQGLSQGEAAAALDVTQDALESLLARARRSLKATLADEWKALLPDGTEGQVNHGRKAGHGNAE